MLQEIVTGCASLGGPPELDAFRKHLPQEWIEEALRATGTATLRRRRLPAEQVVWLVLGMALFKDRSITDVVNKPDLALPGSGKVTVAPSAIAQARARLGQEPVRWLFEQCAKQWAHQSADGDRWRDLALYAVDGTSLRVPDSEANQHEFGLIVGRLAPEGSGYPVMRAVALMALRSHMLTAVAFGPCKHGEHTYARQLWSEIPDDSLTIVDRGFQASNVLHPLHQGGSNRHFLVRARSDTTGRVVTRTTHTDELVEFTICAATRRKEPTLPLHWRVRRIRYRMESGKEQMLLTSLLGPTKYPAKEIVALYPFVVTISLAYPALGSVPRFA